MAKQVKDTKRKIESYAHPAKDRANNPPVGLVTPDTDPDMDTKTYVHDQHLDPHLTWAGKAEHTSFDVPTVSLHVHERVDPRTIIDAVRKCNGTNNQLSLFDTLEENPPIRQAIEFYKHRHNWSNRLIAGDSLLVMNSLLEKEGLGGGIQTVYIDPPYGIRYGSNFQPFVNQRNVNSSNKDNDLTGEPEQIRAFRDTWELGIHSYLTYMRDRLLLSRELLHQSGSCFVQIGNQNLHHVRELMDEVFGPKNFISQIYFSTTSGFSTSMLSRVGDFLVWYARDRTRIKYHQLFQNKHGLEAGDDVYNKIELMDGTRRPMSKDERNGIQPLPDGARIFCHGDLQSPDASNTDTPFEFDEEIYRPNQNSHWKAKWPDGMMKLKAARRIGLAGNKLKYIRYISDNPVKQLTNSWMDTSSAFAADKRYVVETNPKVVMRCILMTTDPGDLVFDPTCGGGTTAFVAEQWGRRWITCDTSRVAITLAKQRMMTAGYTYYELARPKEGICSGFRYKCVPHITLGSIANNYDIHEGMGRDAIDTAIARNALLETLYDQPKSDRSKVRVTGPFTVEAVPAPTVRPIDEIVGADGTLADSSIARMGMTIRHADWQDELMKTGIRGKAGQRISFVRLEPLRCARWLHAEGETRLCNTKTDGIQENTTLNPVKIVVSFGPDHAPMEQKQVELAIKEAQTLVPQPKIIVFAAFQFDPEASKDIDETSWPGVTLLKAQMNVDLLTDDLRKKRSSNESFLLIGQPEVELERIQEVENHWKFRIVVHGFDYYNMNTGEIESGGSDRIAMWMLDTDYDGRSLFARQVFFPMAGAKDGWTKLKRNLKAEIDSSLIEAYHGTVSLPFEAGDHNRVAVKIVDDRGIESLKIVELIL